MKVPYSWLRDFVPDLDLQPDALADIFSTLGLECDGVERIGGNLDGIVVARVLTTQPHPQADKIQIVHVDSGGAGYPPEVAPGEPLQICCGAFNMHPGDLVPLATLGTVMPDSEATSGGLEILRRKLRGEWSNGMLCSSREIGLGDDHEGIFILAADSAAPGTPIAHALGIETDSVFDLSVNPNRPDAMSIAGVARDLAAFLGLAFRLPDVPDLDVTPTSDATVSVSDPVGCGRFHAWVLGGVSVRPSPGWIQRRLTLAGMRPISNVVDASNYVMLELGRPNHTFDLAQLPGRGIRVRRAHPGEQIVTLDGVARSLSVADLVVCDANDAVSSIAGIMGGASSEINDSTTEVLLEQAWWNPLTIAKTSKRLGLRTEASARFERGTDWEIISFAAARFVDLLGDAVDRSHIGEVDVVGHLPDRSPIPVRLARVTAVLGADIPEARVRSILDRIGYTTATAEEPGVIRVALPPWRLDSTLEIDVIEEIARHYGYEHIVKQTVFGQRGGLTPVQARRRRLREILNGAGVFEAMPNPFVTPGDVAAAGYTATPIEINDPIVADESVLRPSLRPGLLRAIAYNQARRQHNVRLYEIGHVFGQPSGKALDRGVALPDEREHVCVVLAGADAADAVRLLNLVCSRLGRVTPRLGQADLAGLHATRGASVMVGKGPIGVVGEISPLVCDAFGIEGRVAIVEIDLDRFNANVGFAAPTFKAVSRFPSSDLDLAFVVPDAVGVDAVRRTLREAASGLAVRCDLFDVYRGPTVSAGCRSLAFNLLLQASDHTLTETELAQVRSGLIAAVEKAHGGVLR